MGRVGSSSPWVWRAGAAKPKRAFATLRSLLVAALFAGVSWQAAAQSSSVLDDPVVRRTAKEGLDLLYDMRFEEASASFEEISARYQEHPIGPFLQALTTWWEILLDFSDTQRDESFYAAMTEVIARSDEILAQDKKDFDAMFFKGAALGFRGRLRLNRRQWLRAAANGKRAMDYVLAVAERDTTNHDYAFGWGLYYYYAAVIPVRHPFARAITTFLPKGDRSLGLQQLRRTAAEGFFLRTEATYFLLQIHYLYEHDFGRCLEHVTWLRKQHPGNSFFHTLEGRIYARWGVWTQAEEIFTVVLDKYKRQARGYSPAMAEQALYFLARARMAAGRFEGAMEFLLPLEALSARLPGDTYFKVMGRLRQGMAYDALGLRHRAVDRYKQVLSMKAWGDSHTSAERYLRAPYDAPL